MVIIHSQSVHWTATQTHLNTAHSHYYLSPCLYLSVSAPPSPFSLDLSTLSPTILSTFCMSLFLLLVLHLSFVCSFFHVWSLSFTHPLIIKPSFLFISLFPLSMWLSMSVPLLLTSSPELEGELPASRAAQIHLSLCVAPGSV